MRFALCSPYMYHPIRSGWTNQITVLFVSRKPKETAKNANHGSAYIYTRIQQGNPPQMWPALLSSLLCLSLERKTMDHCLSAVVFFFDTDIWTLFSPDEKHRRKVYFSAFFLLFPNRSFLNKFPSISFLSAVVPSFLAVVVVQFVCAVGFLLARLHRGGHPRREFDRNLKYP